MQLVASKSSDVKVLKFAKQVTSLQVKVVAFIFISQHCENITQAT